MNNFLGELKQERIVEKGSRGGVGGRWEGLNAREMQLDDGEE